MANNRGKPETKSTSEVNSQEMEIAADASKVDYVEIMACPNGCINGGGQISAPNTTTTTSITLPQKEIEKQWINAVLEKYNSIPMFDLSSQSSSSSSSPNEIIKFIEWSKNLKINLILMIIDYLKLILIPWRKISSCQLMILLLLY